MFAGLKRKAITEPQKPKPEPLPAPEPPQKPPTEAKPNENPHRIFGQESARAALALWDKKKPLLLCGSSLGKTTLAREALKDYRIWSEDESPSEAIQVLSTRPPLTGGKWAMLIECAEGLGDERAKVVEELKKAKIPIIITCDDPRELSMKSLKLACQVINLKPLDLATATKALQHVAASNNFSMSEDSCHQILEASSNNIRQATNAMLFLVATKHRKREGETVIGILDKAGDMFAETAQICSGQKIEPVIDMDMLTLMLHQNLPLSARNLQSLSAAFTDLTTVDIMTNLNFLRFWTMFSEDLLVRSVSLACSGPHRCPPMTFPAYLKNMGSRSSRTRKIRTAAGFVLPTTGPMIKSMSKHDYEISYAPLEKGSRLDQIYPSGLEALERLEVHTARVAEKKTKNTKAPNLLDEDSMKIVRSGLFR
jgi:hypothetical protein